jgi:hypothetical protein
MPGAPSLIQSMCAMVPTSVMMNRIPTALDLTLREFASLRNIVIRSFTPLNQVAAPEKERLLELGLIQIGMGGLMPTPAGRIVARL